MAYAFRLTSGDLARVRFAASPLWETAHAVRTLIDPEQRAYHLPWLDEVRPRLAGIDVEPLLAINPMHGYTPDLIAPAPQHPRTTAAEQLDQVRRTPLEHVRTELTRSRQERDRPMPAEMAALVDDPARARIRIADALEACWEALIAPYWPRIGDLLAADIAHHSRLLAERGLEALFPALGPDLSWHDDTRTLRLDRGPGSERRDTAGAGLLLQPSAFVWPRMIAVTDRPYQPAVVYPARGVAELWQPSGAATDTALATLLGRTRALLLASVREPASTTTLARRHRLAPATVSQHLAALAGARLVSTTRVGKQVLYATTDLGDQLLTG